MLSTGTPAIYGAANPGEYEWVACCLLLGPSDLSKQHLLEGCFPLPVLININPSMLCLTRGSFFILLLIFLVDNGNLKDPKDHPSCFWTTKVLTADLPVDFKRC